MGGLGLCDVHGVRRLGGLISGVPGSGCGFALDSGLTFDA